MLTRFPFLAHTGFFFCFLGPFFVVVFGVVFSSLLDGSKTILEPNMAQLEPMLEPCWPLFGTFLGVVLASQLKIAFKMIFC